MSSIYSISNAAGSERVVFDEVWTGSGATLASGYTSLVPIQTRTRTCLVAYSKTTQKADVYALDARTPWIVPVDSCIDLAGGPWDSLHTFVLGNVTYLLAYRADTGTFSFFALKDDLSVSQPYSFALPRNTPTHDFTDIAPFTSLGQQYMLGYDFNTGRVATFSVNVTAGSTDGTPPLLAQNLWYHQWAKGWTRFSFFQLGGSNFFFKINTAKLNVNIDHLQDNPALGTVEVGSYLQDQLPDALSITAAACTPWEHGEPYLLTYIAPRGATALYRIHPDCLGWTRVGETTAATNASLVTTYRIGGTSYALFYQP